MQQCVTIYHVHNMLHLFGPWDKISISHHFSFNAHSHPIWGLVVRFNEGRCTSNCISIFLNCIFIFQYFFLYFCISELYFYISELFFILFFNFHPCSMHIPTHFSSNLNDSSSMNAETHQVRHGSIHTQTVDRSHIFFIDIFWDRSHIFL